MNQLDYMLDLFDYQNLPTQIHVKVTPNAKSERIKKEVRENDSILYRVYVTASPEDGKANQAVLKLISESLGVAKSHLEITHGITCPDKTIKINQ